MSNNTQSLPKTAVDQGNDEIDLSALMLTLLRGWKVIVLLAILGLIVGMLYTRYVNPIFEADALIQVEDNKSQGISALGANISQLVAPISSQSQTEAELIKSRMVLKPVVDLLHLDIQLSDPIIGYLGRLQKDRINTQINTPEGISLKTRDGQVRISEFVVPQAYLNQTFTLMRTDTGFVLSDDINRYEGSFNQLNSFRTTAGEIQIIVTDLPTDQHPIKITKQTLQTTTDAINKSLTVAEMGKLAPTGIIKLSLKGTNQQQVSLILNEIVLSYIDQNQSRGSEETTRTLKFMETQIPALKQKLDMSEAAYNKFREKSGTIDIGKEAELLVTENYQIDAQINELKLKKAELTTYYTGEHPLVIQINDQLRTLNARQAEISNTVERLPEIQREFLKLSEDANINKEIYLTMLKNYEQLKIVKAGQIGFARIVDLPISTFNIVAPKSLLIWLLALLIGGILGTLLVLFRSLTRNVVTDPERLEAKMGVPVVATIPRSKSLIRLSKNKRATNPVKAGQVGSLNLSKNKRATNQLLSYVDHNSLSYEAIKSLRTFLMFGMLDQGKVDQISQVIVLTAESPDVGKSFICANLAEVFSQLDKKILIIDADMRLGDMHKTFNVEQDTGLADYFSSDNNTVSSITHSTNIDNIDLIPCGERPSNPSSLLASNKFGKLMAELTTHYDYIFINSPPILAATDAVILAQYADKVLMVTRYNDSLEGQLAYAIKQMNKANVEVDGIVLNDMQQGMLDKHSYNYAYTYGNSK
ncbi:polysaccharide biosynthesis tyrosine autokinase [Psychrobacter sp. CAL346-MNA-CIBAN-0220]|uniref:polysaccharide biosynthesis tyrosine autokinase n=1 Tax=Psychrobacter sp. CAL346-MNA-CIBAN-0220 TaxID=3140457 RepID=UPI003317F17F